MPVEFGEALSEREHEIIQLVAEGLTNREIAVRVFLSPNTVKVHLRNIFTKTGVASRTELSMLAIQEGWITIPGAENSEAPQMIGVTESAVMERQEATDQAGPLPPAPTPWPWQRWLALALSVLLAAVIFLLPRWHNQPAAFPGPGQVFGATTQRTEVYEPEMESQWLELPPLTVRRAGLAVAAANNRIYVIGGMTGEGATERVDSYDVAAGVWRQEPSLPQGLANISAVTLDDTLLVPGGCTSEWDATDAVLRFDLQESAWSEVASLPRPLCAYALVTHQKRVYLFGGWDGHSYRDTAYVYDTLADTWTEIAPPQTARGFGGAASIGDYLFYVGGYDGRRELNTCEVYLPEENTWTSCAPMLQPRGGLGLVAIGGRLYAMGGGWNSTMGFNEQYSPAKDQWSIVETPIVGEWRNLGVVAWDTSIYAVGGWDGGDFLNRTYTLEIMPWRVFIPGAFKGP